MLVNIRGPKRHAGFDGAELSELSWIEDSVCGKVGQEDLTMGDRKGFRRDPTGKIFDCEDVIQDLELKGVGVTPTKKISGGGKKVKVWPKVSGWVECTVEDLKAEFWFCEHKAEAVTVIDEKGNEVRNRDGSIRVEKVPVWKKDGGVVKLRRLIGRATYDVNCHAWRHDVEDRDTKLAGGGYEKVRRYYSNPLPIGYDIMLEWEIRYKTSYVVDKEVEENLREERLRRHVADRFEQAIPTSWSGRISSGSWGGN